MSMPEFTDRNVTKEESRKQEEYTHRDEMIANAEPDTLRRALRKAILGLPLSEMEQGELLALYSLLSLNLHSAYDITAIIR